MHEYRVAKVLCALVGSEWKTFDQIALDPSALEAKQLAGTLVAMRNRGIVQSRRVHRETGGEVMQWRLNPIIARMQR